MKTISEIRREGIEALSKALGPIDMARFISSFEHGSGDYTKERHQWLPNDREFVLKSLLERQKMRDEDDSSSSHNI